MDQQSVPSAQRRNFLFIMVGAVGVALGGLISWPVWKYLAPGKKSGELEKISIARGDVALGKAHFFNFHGRPAVVLQPEPGDFAAFSAVCTHLGCVVKWVADKQEFLCPCHGGKFSTEGTVLGGPPPKPLESLPVAVQGDQVLVG
jgi:cytochrome b6-f complex iron-sulfur subunit